ncbi:MAG: acyl-[ACP]--phospholipid O-acyltransferase [Epsilonproteobacteria bacterium]|nr:acyl-[ACP]--phospholipid O-acyltransferase [Campylobacterota bacterium]
MKELFRVRGFLPYLVIIFLNAMTDLGHKITLQNTIFKAYSGSELIILTSIVNALILLPFILLFSPAGYISDKYPKTKVIKYSSAFAIFVTILILISYFLGLFWLSFILTFLLAAQSAIYSPAKYGLIKEMVGSRYLTPANGIVQAITVVSILLGALIYSIFFEMLVKDTSSPSIILKQAAPLGFLLILASVVEFLLALKLEKELRVETFVKKEPFRPKLYFNFTYLKKNLRNIYESKIVWESIIGLSIIWAIAQVLVAIFGEFLKSTLGVTNTIIVQGLLTLSGVGMIFGSLFAGAVSKKFIEIGIIPLGALGMAISLFLIPNSNNLDFIGVLLFLFGFFAGLVAVPLNSLIQFFTPKSELGVVLAGSNFMQNLFMFIALILTAIFGYFNFSSTTLLYLIAFIAALGFIYTLLTMPQSLIRYIIRMIVRMRYRIDVDGIENLEGKRGILLLGNHISFLDWAILQIAYPRQIRFVVDRVYYNRWYLKPFLKFAKTIPISSKGSKNALAEVTKALNNGQIVAIFPEGHISRNGHLDEFKSGFEMATKDVTSDAVIIPFYLRGLWEDNFSYASKKLKRSKIKDISVSFGKPMDIHSKANEVKKAVFELSISAWQNYSKRLKPICESWIENLPDNPSKLAVADSTGVELSKLRFATAVFLFSKKLKPILKDKHIGLILPSTAAGLIANMAVLALGKVIVNLNYSAGIKSLKSALNLADINQIITSRQFIKRLKDKGFDLDELLKEVEVIYLEDIKKSISKLEGLKTLIATKLLPIALLKALYIKKVDISDTAAILFSSGSEGTPKGIELTHQNIMGNIKQTLTLINPTDDDVILATLPIFHSFGLTVTSLLPLVEDISIAAHPDPTDGLGVAKMCAKYNGTFMFGTATFYGLYVRNKKINPLMFKSLRMVVAGAEKLPRKIYKDFKDRFNLEIYEGYGATETTPVASVNIPDVLLVDDNFKVQKGNKPGSVGLPVPGSSFKIVDPDTFKELPANEAGMILIGGTQIMKGYIKNPQKTKEVIKVIDGIRWYVTGDKGYLDEDGFLTIVDRYSRFAKIGGEMVSLGMVEGEIFKVINEGDKIAISAVPDSKKGEKLVLLLEGEMSIDELKQKIKELKLNPLFIPSIYFKVKEIPKLGSGKVDLKGLKKMVLELVKGS